MSESTLKIRIVGNYSIKQAEPEENCRICGNVDFGDVLINGICGKCLVDFHAFNYGGWATDSLDKILGVVCDSENQPHQFINAPEKIKDKFFWHMK